MKLDKGPSGGAPPHFLVTIDTEGDNLWSRPRDVTTENSRFLGRFHDLCERFGLRPTYLVNYEMARCPVFVELARSVLAADSGEIGMHLHAWNSPPFHQLTEDDIQHHPYLIEFPEPVVREKVAVLTGLLQDTFGVSVRSHRAGRWAFNSFYARTLLEYGYEADCSVTPNVSWSQFKGDPKKAGGTDYRGHSELPYLHQEEVAGQPKVLVEAPMTILRVPDRSALVAHLTDSAWLPQLGRRAVNHFFPKVVWLRPNGSNRKKMLWILDQVLEQKRPYAQFMIHSSELMPGGSPTFRDRAAIERLYRDLEVVFDYARGKFRAATLGEFSSVFRAAHGAAHAAAQPQGMAHSQ